MTAITERIAAEHHGLVEAEAAYGCRCGAHPSGLDGWVRHIAEVTEAAVREQVARDILAQRERYSCTGLEDAAYDDAAWIARGGA